MTELSSSSSRCVRPLSACCSKRECEKIYTWIPATTGRCFVCHQTNLSRFEQRCIIAKMCWWIYTEYKWELQPTDLEDKSESTSWWICCSTISCKYRSLCFQWRFSITFANDDGFGNWMWTKFPQLHWEGRRYPCDTCWQAGPRRYTGRKSQSSTIKYRLFGSCRGCRRLIIRARKRWLQCKLQKKILFTCKLYLKL